MIDVSTVRNFTGVTDIAVVSDPDIEFYIATAEAQISEYTGLAFGETFVSEKYDGDGTNTLKVRYTPIINICSIFADGICIVDYISEKEKGLIILKEEVFPLGKQNIQINYTHGILETSDPYLFNLAKKLCLYLSARSVLLASTSGIDFAVRSEKLAEYTLSYDYPVIDRIRFLDIEIEKLWAIIGKGDTISVI